MSPSIILYRVREWLRRSEIDHEFEEEIATHLELARAEHLKRGLPPGEAQQLAALQFGKITTAKEAVWEEQRLPGPGSLLQDAGYGCAALLPLWFGQFGRAPGKNLPHRQRNKASL